MFALFLTRKCSLTCSPLFKLLLFVLTYQVFPFYNFYSLSIFNVKLRHFRRMILLPSFQLMSFSLSISGVKHAKKFMLTWYSHTLILHGPILKKGQCHSRWFDSLAPFWLLWSFHRSIKFFNMLLLDFKEWVNNFFAIMDPWLESSVSNLCVFYRLWHFLWCTYLGKMFWLEGQANFSNE